MTQLDWEGVYRAERDILWDALLLAKGYLIKGRTEEAMSAIDGGLDRRTRFATRSTSGVSDRADSQAEDAA